VGKVTEITVIRGATINKGNYQSKRVEYSITQTIDEADDVDAEIDSLKWQLDKMLAKDGAKKIMEEKK